MPRGSPARREALVGPWWGPGGTLVGPWWGTAGLGGARRGALGAPLLRGLTRPPPPPLGLLPARSQRLRRGPLVSGELDGPGAAPGSIPGPDAGWRGTGRWGYSLCRP